MKPCDCKSMVEVRNLKEQGLRFNNYAIEVDSSGILITIYPYVSLKINHKNFKRFAEWYLEDQI